MKHDLRITFIILALFVLAQLLGLYVVNHYQEGKNELPFGLQSPTIQNQSDYYSFFPSIILAFIFAILIFFFLTKVRVEFILKAWFFAVVVISLSISFLSILSPIKNALLFSFVLASCLAALKVFKRNFIVHNATEIFIYPGIASVFVPLLNPWTVIALLILISIYDAWAVWHSGIMQKMAKYQIDKLKIFSGFFVPYLSKQLREKIAKLKKKLPKSKLKKQKIRVNVAILGGGDIVFPIITAGVMLKAFGIVSALWVIAGATLGLTYLFFISEKKKFYPAMPFITAGIILGVIASLLFL